MAATTRTVTAALRKAGYPYVELVSGKDYLYFVWDDGKNFETESVYVPRFSELTLEQWMDAGTAFAKQCQANFPAESNSHSSTSK